jgi:hypothetical protein
MREGVIRSACGAAVVFAAALVLPVLSAAAPAARPEQVAEADLKVAYTISFLKFLTHHEGPSRFSDSTVRLCVVGNGSVSSAFMKANGLKLQLETDRTLKVDRSSHRLSPEALADCWAVYVDSDNRNRLESIAKQLAGKGILLISESKGALSKGAMLNLLRVGSKLRWEMNRESLETEGLSMSAQVYRNAVRVE